MSGLSPETFSRVLMLSMENAAPSARYKPVSAWWGFIAGLVMAGVIVMFAG